MEAPRFDTLTRLMGAAPSRRALLPLLGGLFAVLLAGGVPTAAKKKKKKKTTLCLDGQTIQASKKRKKKLIKSGATSGACSPPPPPGCTPTCQGNQCGGDDGCGAICGCAAGSICHGGACQACTVTCTGGAAECGADLNTRLAGGGTVYACPGRYVGNFTVGNVALIGAGAGDDPASNTILDANGSGRVITVKPSVTALQGLRITGGKSGQGGGIVNEGGVTITDCTITGNASTGNVGGGIYAANAATGPVTLQNCTISDNTAATVGGGIANLSPLTMTIHGTAITGNRGDSGGGFYTNLGTITFDSACSVTGNEATGAPGGGGIRRDGGTVNLNGANVNGNTPNNCIPVNAIAGCVG